MLDPSPSTSERSIYFDAPIAIFHSYSTHQPQLPQIMPSTISDVDTQQNGEGASVVRQPTVAGPGNTTKINGGLASPSLLSDTAEEEPEAPRPLAHRQSSGWLPAEDVDEDPQLQQQQQPSGAAPKRSSTLLRKNNSISRRSNYSRRATSPSMAESVGHKSVFTNAEGRPVAGSTFINGAGVTGPNAMAQADPSLHERRATADGQLTVKQRKQIEKAEGEYHDCPSSHVYSLSAICIVKDGRRLTKVIKTEGKIEKQALQVAVKELGELQKFQENAVKVRIYLDLHLLLQTFTYTHYSESLKHTPRTAKRWPNSRRSKLNSWLCAPNLRPLKPK